MKRFARAILIFLAGQAVAIPFAFVLLIASMPVLRALEASTGIEMVGHSGPASWIIYSIWAVISAIITATLVATRSKKRMPPND